MQVATSGLHEDVYIRLSIRTTLEDLVSRRNRRDATGTLRHLQEHSFGERDSGVAASCFSRGQRGRDLTSCFSGVRPEHV
jgi:hypothetical protein